VAITWQVYTYERGPSSAALTSILTPSRLSYTQVWNDVGEWMVEVPWTTQAAAEALGLRRSNFLDIVGNGQWIIGGPIRELRLAVSKSGLPILRLKGPSYLTWCRERVVDIWDMEIASPFDLIIVTGGTLDDVIKQIGRDHITDVYISDAGIVNPYMAVAADTSEHPSAGPSYSYWSARLTSVLSEMQRIAWSGEFSSLVSGVSFAPTPTQFDVIRTSIGATPTLTTWVPRAGSDYGIGQTSAVILDLDLMVDPVYVESAAGVRNSLLVAGTGNGHYRDYGRWNNGASVVADGAMWGYTNGHATTVDKQTVQAELAEQGTAQVAASFTIPSDQAGRYLSDFAFGDQLTVQWRDIQITETIGALSVDARPGAPDTVRLMVGRRGIEHSGILSPLRAMSARLDRRLQALEAAPDATYVPPAP